MVTSKKAAERRLPKIVRILHARIKLVISAIAVVAVALLLPSEWRWITRILIGWDTGVALYLCILGWAITRAEVAHIRLHSEMESEGRIATLFMTVAATLASIAAIIVLLGHGEGKNDASQLLFAVATVLLSWAFIHSIFAVHYTHEFYSERPSAGGLKFPGDKKPDYSDFFYFAFVIGMTFQVSDVAVTDRSIRRAVLAHGVVSFLFNVALLAIMINIAASAL